MLKLDAQTIKQYVEEDLIMEFDSEIEALEYFNTYDYQNFKSVDEMKEYQGDYGFGFGGKWYHINYDHVLEEFQKKQGMTTEEYRDYMIRRILELQTQNQYTRDALQKKSTSQLEDIFENVE